MLVLSIRQGAASGLPRQHRGAWPLATIAAARPGRKAEAGRATALDIGGVRRDAGAVDTELNIVAATPDELPGPDLDMFASLVAGGGEVPGVALATNIRNARVLAMCRSEECVVGTAALKRPQASYRRRVGANAGFALDEATHPYELGYVVLLPGVRGRGASHFLVAEALRHADGEAVFATTRTDNAAMLATLAKAGFEQAGSDYRGRDDRTLRLLVGPATSHLPAAQDQRGA